MTFGDRITNLAREASFRGNGLVIGRRYVIRIRIDLEGRHVPDLLAVASWAQGIDGGQAVAL